MKSGFPTKSEPAVSIPPGESDELLEVFDKLRAGLIEGEGGGLGPVEEAVGKIRRIGTDRFKSWSQSGELARLLYEHILSLLDRAALLGAQDAVELLTDLGVSKKISCCCDPIVAR